MARMARHVESSFDEAKAIRFLSDKLEEKHRIKTFFKENDRTPDIDGFFELIDGDGVPQKQFIVQIKKVNSLSKIIKGKHADLYPYDLDTKFLYYVKEKVTESPAIYFVIDIDNQRIFYIYLSDEKLMSIDFENKENVRYWFCEEDILSDVDYFYNRLLQVSIERNKRYVNKSSQEIAELQEAADYINTLLNGELRNIKSAVFPNLWRFGIGFTQSCEVKVEHRSFDETMSMGAEMREANLFGLYPQIKGKTDPEIGDYRGDSFFKSFDFTKQNTPIEYTKSVVNKMVREYCLKPPLEVLPTIVLMEMTNNKMRIIHSFVGEGECFSISEAISDFHIMLSYLDYILKDTSVLSEWDMQKRRIIINLLNTGSNHCIGLSNFLLWGGLQEHVNKQDKTQVKTIRKGILDLIKLSDYYYYLVLLELRKRKVENIEVIWNNAVLLDNQIDAVAFYEKYYKSLIPLYHETYNRVFDSNKFLFSRKIEYSLKNEDSKLYMLSRVDIAPKGELSIKCVDSQLIEDDNLYNNIGLRYEMVNDTGNKTWLYNGIRCFLFQGICDALGFDCQGLSIDGLLMKVFG